MPPAKKPQVFKTPDGKEFPTRAAWRDYMMATFYSFKNKNNEPEPLVKPPGSIEGQMFDIADCENSTLVIMDHTEQIQIDVLKNCRVFIGACTSSIFIRNCSNCTFYTCCRQLRLREVVDCKFYIYSMAEVHIEFSSKLFFAPFNGGYPEHAAHLKAAMLDPNHNLWYDVYDHNDPNKTHEHWALLPESEYEQPWFPAGAPCEPAIQKNKPGSVKNMNQSDEMQSFSLEQLKADAEKIATSSPNKSAPPPPTVSDTATAAAATSGTDGAPLPPPAVSMTLEQAAQQRAVTPGKKTSKLPPVGTAAATPDSAATAAADAAPVVAPPAAGSSEAELTEVLKLFAGFKAGEDFAAIAHESFTLLLPDGKVLTRGDLSAVAPVSANELWTVDRLQILACGDVALSTFWATDGENDNGEVCHYSTVLQKAAGSAFGWVLMVAQKSLPRPFAEAPPPFYS